MGNPRPTKSKPVKIGRKHTGAKSSRLKQRQQNGRVSFQRQEQARHRKTKAAVREYWDGLRDECPAE